MREKKVHNFLEITDKMARHEIVQKVVNTFIGSEWSDRGKGIQFWYPVENLADGSQLFIIRPGGLRSKWNFDFKVNIEPEYKLGKGTHNEVTLDFQNKKLEAPEKYPDLLRGLTEIYECNNAVDQVVQEIQSLGTSFHTGADVKILLKVVKWMFIMEDIVYWNYQGRTMLYSHLMKA